MKLTKSQLKFIEDHPPSNYGTDGGLVWEELRTLLEQKCPKVDQIYREPPEIQKTFNEIDREITLSVNTYMPDINYRRDIIGKIDANEIEPIEYAKIPMHPHAKDSKEVMLMNIDDLMPKIQKVCAKFTKTDLEKVKKVVKDYYSRNLNL